jgi:hypothetical protein
MKRLIVAMAVILFVAWVGVSYSAELFAPNQNKTGTIGTSTRMWGDVWVNRMNNPIMRFASHDYNSLTVPWTLSATERQADILFVTGVGNGVSVDIIAPSEQRLYYVFNGGLAGSYVRVKVTGAAATYPGAVVTGAHNMAQVIFVTLDYRLAGGMVSSAY